MTDKRWIYLGLFSLYCLAFGSLRFFLEGDAWGFLHHNLWLAWIPLIIAAVIRFVPLNNWQVAALWICWLLFLPNAPYIVTDLIHVRFKATLLWFDLVLLFHFAVAGLLVGALALHWVEHDLSHRSTLR